MNLDKKKVTKSFIGTLFVFCFFAVVDGTDMVWGLSAIYFFAALLYFSIQKVDHDTKSVLGKLASKYLTKNLASELLEVKKLQDAGVLSDEEYEQKITKLKSKYMDI